MTGLPEVASLGKEVLEPGFFLKDGEKMEIEVEVEDVLLHESPSLLEKESRQRLMTGGQGADIPGFRESLVEKRRIYFLCWDVEHSPRLGYYYPFFGRANLTYFDDSVDKVRVVIKRQNEDLK